MVENNSSEQEDFNNSQTSTPQQESSANKAGLPNEENSESKEGLSDASETMLNEENKISENSDPKSEGGFQEADKSGNKPDEGSKSQNNNEAKVEDEPSPEDESIGVIDSPGSLKRKKERIESEIEYKNTYFSRLNNKFRAIIDGIEDELDPSKKYVLEARKLKLEKEKKVLETELDKLESELLWIEKKLKQYEYSRRKSSSDQSKDAEQFEKNLPKHLFEKAKPIEQTLLFAATFFDNLSPPHFEKVVLWLLEGRKTTIKVESKVITEQGEIKTIEESQEKLMTEIWSEAVQNPDSFLSNCRMGSIALEDDSQVIDFFSPQLRDKFKEYFRQEQPLYLSEQYKKSRLLLFDQDLKVAIGAMSLSVYMAAISPDAYGRDWLFEIASRVPLDGETNPESLEQLVEGLLKEIESARQRWFICGRVSSLIAQMLDYPRLHSVVESFFNRLIGQTDYLIVLEVAKRLFSHPQFDGFYWFKQLLDRGNEKVKDWAYKFLCRHLNQSGLYIFDSLEKIKLWLPEPGTSPNRYSPSNKYALRILPEHCDRSIEILDANSYGNFPPQYPLLEALYGDDLVEKNLNLLFAWLFHPELDSSILNYLDYLGKDNKSWNSWKDVYEELAKDLKDDNQEITQSPEKSSSSQSPTNVMLELLRAGCNSPEECLSYFSPLLLTEWCVILWGLDNKEPEPEALELVNYLIQKITVYTKNSHKRHDKNFLNCWSIFGDYLLNKADHYRESSDRKLKKRYMRKRSIVKHLSKQFKTQLKESKKLNK